MDRQAMIVITVLLIVATLFYSSSQRYTNGMVVSDSNKNIISTPNAYGDNMLDDSLLLGYGDESFQQRPNEVLKQEAPILDADFIRSNPVDCKKLPEQLKRILHEACA